MSKLLDYIRWRGDLSFKHAKFNSLDAAFFASIVYLPFNSSFTNHSLGEISKRLYLEKNSNSELSNTENLELNLIPLSARFSNIKVLDWTSTFKKNPPVQFAAMTIELDSDTILISIRGTDGSIIGLNEDIDMSYSPEITGQGIAAEYVNRIALRYPSKKIIIVGHSKGGNFAAYSASTLSISDQNRVIKVYSFDGPGFMKSTYSTPNFKNILPKLITYVPEGSLFGIMLDHPERVLVVKSDAQMWKQHNLNTWSVARNGFVLASGLTNASRIFRHSLITWNTKIPREKREALWLSLFSEFENKDIVSINQLNSSVLHGVFQLSSAYRSFDSETRSIANNMLLSFSENIKKNINIPFINKASLLKPLGNDSSKGPILNDSYDGS